jgi:hypothetical protein
MNRENFPARDLRRTVRRRERRPPAPGRGLQPASGHSGSWPHCAMAPAWALPRTFFFVLNFGPNFVRATALRQSSRRSLRQSPNPLHGSNARQYWRGARLLAKDWLSKVRLERQSRAQRRGSIPGKTDLFAMPLKSRGFYGLSAGPFQRVEHYAGRQDRGQHDGFFRRVLGIHQHQRDAGPAEALQLPANRGILVGVIAD